MVDSLCCCVFFYLALAVQPVSTMDSHAGDGPPSQPPETRFRDESRVRHGMFGGFLGEPGAQALLPELVQRYLHQAEPPATQTDSSSSSLLSLVQLTPTSTLLNRLAFAVITGEKFANSRAVAVKETWCSSPGTKCYYFSEHDDPTLPTVKISTESNVDLGNDYQSAQLKFLPAIQHIKNSEEFKHNEIDWIFVVDDDTYVFAKNLLNLISHYNPADRIYVGDVWKPTLSGINSVHALDGSEHTTNIDFVMGGGGSGLSRAALQEMDIDSCIERTQRGGEWYGWQSDWIIAACANMFHITPTDEQSFHQVPRRHFGFGEFDDSEYIRDPVTLHPMDPDGMHALFADFTNGYVVPVHKILLKCLAKDRTYIAFCSKFVQDLKGFHGK